MINANFGHGAEIRPYNPIRIIEWILCLICLILAIHILIKIDHLHIVFKSIFLLVAVAFFFITLVDIIVTTLLKPILWPSWIMFAIMGSLAFFLCGGFLIIQVYPFTLILFTATLVANAITGCVFLLEVLHIIIWLRDDEGSVTTLKEKPVETRPSDTSSHNKREDKSNQLGNYLQRMGNNKLVQYPSDAVLAPSKIICVKNTCPKKCTEEVPSHGGTFHVSKDVAPILSPSSLRTIRSTTTTPSSASNYRFNNILAEPYDNTTQTPIDRRSTIKSITFSISAQSSPRTNHTPIDNTSIDPSNTFIHEENIDVSGVYHTAPQRNEISHIPVTVQRYYAGKCCGKVHHCNAADATATYSTDNKYKFDILPTLQEDSSYSSAEEPTRDCAWSSSNSDQPSPGSGETANTSYKTYSLEIENEQIYPFEKPSCSRLTLHNTETQLRLGNLYAERGDFTEKREPQLPSCSSKVKRFTGVGSSIFSYETKGDTKAIQTQPYQMEIKNNFSNTYSFNCISNEVNQHDNGEPRYTNQKNNTKNVQCGDYLRKGDGRKFKKYNTEKRTVLPGATDSPPRTAKEKRPQNSENTIIDVSDDQSDYSIKNFKYTRNPVMVKRKGRSQLSRHPKTCTVM